MTQPDNSGWKFIDDNGSFCLNNPHHYSSLYLPLCNEAGIFSAITPTLHGDIKAGYNSYLTPPVTVENLHDSLSARNFWIGLTDGGPWSAAGNSARQVSHHFSDSDEESLLEVGLLWHRVTRKNGQIGIQAEITSFVPASNDRVELMKVTITNQSGIDLKFTPIAAIPIYGRSADNLRDHRHVTSLLHRTYCGAFGVLVRPTLTFDERGHKPNMLTYSVLGVEEDGTPPIGYFPVEEDFIGEGGSLDWPQAIVQKRIPEFRSGMSVNGYESIGGLCFRDVSLMPGEKRSFVVIMAITAIDETDHLISEYGSMGRFDAWLEQTKAYWNSKIDVPHLYTGDKRYEGWLRWVTVQPVLRRIFGNSFLPYHDYGRGGRGWRDLWQDILTLVMMEGGNISQLLYDNISGVRMDGSNATIVGSSAGDFKADRNNIPRVWMDHGVWPLLSIGLYIDQTGDLEFLLRKQVYFKDSLAGRAMFMDSDWLPEQGTELWTTAGEVYQGSILEHLLVQQLVPFFNVGEHNSIRLEEGDWNDAMDMAGERGESVALTAMFAGNLHRLSELALALGQLEVLDVEIAEEVIPLLDSLGDVVDYNSVSAKQIKLRTYFKNCSHTISGRKTIVSLKDLTTDLDRKANWLINHLRAEEWLTDSAGYGWYNGYYDNKGKRVEGEFPMGVHMTLTSQVFALLGGVANNKQAKEIVRSVDRYLYEARVGGYKLNTDFGEGVPDLGRAFGFAYGHKENGAMFSHMAVMYAYALYQRGMAKQGRKVLEGIYQYCQGFAYSHIYPGIPEYINARGRGMYTYLTGSASWYILTLINEVFGVRGIWGDLMFEPKLMAEQFDQEAKARLIIYFADRKLDIIFHNPDRLDYGDYGIRSFALNNKLVEFTRQPIIISRNSITALNINETNHIEIELGTRKKEL